MQDIIKNIAKVIEENKEIIYLFLGLFIQRTWEELSKPKLSFTIIPSAKINHITPKCKISQIRISNVKRNLLFRIILGNRSVNSAKAQITFLDTKSNTKLFSMGGRWSSKREPLNYITKKVNFAEALIIPRETIAVNESTTVPIAIKQSGEKVCYGFNNESYLNPTWKNPDFEIDIKRISVIIKISSEGREWKKKLSLLNPGLSLRHFKLGEYKMNLYQLLKENFS